MQCEPNKTIATPAVRQAVFAEKKKKRIKGKERRRKREKTREQKEEERKKCIEGRERNDNRARDKERLGSWGGGRDTKRGEARPRQRNNQNSSNIKNDAANKKYCKESAKSNPSLWR